MIVVFVHLERGGGVTFKDILGRYYKNIFDIRHSKDFAKRQEELISMPTEEKLRIELVQGHQYYGIHRYLFSPFKYITMLRHPISGVISAYQNYRRQLESPYHDSAMTYSLEEFIKRGCKLSFDNGIVRHLSNMWPHEVRWGEVTSEHLKQAKENLNFFLAGTTEHYDATLVYFHHVLNWNKLPLYSHANYAKKEHKTEVDSQTYKLITENNLYDLDLYEYAVKNFHKKTNRIPNFEDKVRRFKILNRTIGRFYIGERLKRLTIRQYARICN